MKTKLFSLLAFGMLTFGNAQTTLLAESFDAITLPGWTLTNQSVPVGTTGWFQGNATVFPAQTGATTSYIGANFNNTTGANTISNWLITPEVLAQDGDVLKFWSRTSTLATFPDRLQVRSSIGTTVLPSGPTGLGSFTTLHLEINPTLLAGPTGYPDVWTEFTITVAGVSATPVALKFAFRYFVVNGGPAGANSNYIGIDTFSITRPALGVSNVNKARVSIYPNPTTDFIHVSSATKVSSLEVYDISGKKINVDLVDGKVDVQNLSKGSYVLKITNADGTAVTKFIKN